MKICPECHATVYEAAPVCPTDGASLLDVSPDDARCGTVLDARYIILSKLGAGGMGTVYTAWQRSTGRVVALKLLAEAISDNPTATERFMREARVTAGLSSPHVVRVHDFGQLEDGTAYMAMEWIDGDPLEDLIDGPMDPKRAIELVRQVCIALEEAHAQGLVHRDLKPGNIIVRQLADGGDFAQVLDFGIAKILDETQTALTHESQNPGTPAYMSPEQARNEPIGPPTDLYALTVILFEMLVGERPFTGTSAMSVLLQHVQATPPRVKSRLPDLPDVDAIDAVLQQGLAKQVKDRYPSAKALRADLDRLKAGAAPEALTHPTVTPKRGFGWNMQALGCSVQLAVAVGALAFFVLPAMRDDAPSQFDDVVQEGAPQATHPPADPTALEQAAERAEAETVKPALAEAPAFSAGSVGGRDDEPAPLAGAEKKKRAAEGVIAGRAMGRATPARDVATSPGRASGGTASAPAVAIDDLAKGDVGSAADDDLPAKRAQAPRARAAKVRMTSPANPPAVAVETQTPAPPPAGRRRVAPPTPASAAEIERRLRAMAPRVRAACGPGHWPLQVLVDVQGRVQTVRITQPGRAAHGKAKCVLKAVREMSFPAPARPVPLRLTL